MFMLCDESNCNKKKKENYARGLFDAGNETMEHQRHLMVYFSNPPLL